MTATLVRIERGIAEFDDGTALMLPGWVDVWVRIPGRSWGISYDGTTFVLSRINTRVAAETVIRAHERARRQNLTLYADMGASA